MTDIDPTQLETGEKLIVSCNDSRYDGTEGTVIAIFEHKIALELDNSRSDDGWGLVSTYPLYQLERP